MSWLRPATEFVSYWMEAEEVEHRVGPAPQRTGGRQQVARDENTARVLGRDLHLRDATVRKEAAL
jgi:hypothetical protein